MMSQLKNMSIVLVIAFAAAILQSTEAVDHTVGGTTGWTNSAPGGASFYSTWASNNTFRVNDVLVFNFGTGAHTVAEVNKANFDVCNVNQNIQLLTTGPARVTLNKTGDFYFICTVSGHCASGGQKLSVKVTSSSPPSPTPPVKGPSPPSPTPPAKGPSPPSPTPPSTTPPTSGNTPTPPTNGGAPPPASTTQPGATPPPSPGSANNLFATFSIVIGVVINLLF